MSRPLPEPEVAEADLEAARRAHHNAQMLPAGGQGDDVRAEKWAHVMALLQVRTAARRAEHETKLNDSFRRWG